MAERNLEVAPLITTKSAREIQEVISDLESLELDPKYREAAQISIGFFEAGVPYSALFAGQYLPLQSSERNREWHPLGFGMKRNVRISEDFLRDWHSLRGGPLGKDAMNSIWMRDVQLEKDELSGRCVFNCLAHVIKVQIVCIV